jgi:hypothetical protein
MQRDEVRKVVTDQVYNSIAASGVEISAIPSGQLRVLVEAIADGLFAALAAIEEEGDIPVMAAQPGVVARPPTPDEPGIINPSGDQAEETRLWQGRPYLSIGIRYELTTQRLRVYRGVLGNRLEEIELIRVKDSQVKQHVGERMLNIGDVTVVSADTTAPEIVLKNVHDPIGVRELIRKTVMDEKARRGLYYREDIGEETN